MHVLPFIMSLFMFIENKVINIKKKKRNFKVIKNRVNEK